MAALRLRFGGSSCWALIGATLALAIAVLGAKENGHAVPGTDADVATYLLPHIDDGWTSP